MKIFENWIRLCQYNMAEVSPVLLFLADAVNGFDVVHFEAQQCVWAVGCPALH